MLHRSDKAKLVKIMQYIGDIQKILLRHGSASSAFNDIEGRHAIMMCLLQIGEILNKVNDPSLGEKLESRKVIAFRNIVAHEYDSIISGKTVEIIEKKIPEMETTVKTILKNESDFLDLEKLWKR